MTALRFTPLGFVYLVTQESCKSKEKLLLSELTVAPLKRQKEHN